MKRWANGCWSLVRPPAGRSARRFIAVVMIIMGLGRLGLYRTASLATSLTDDQYGWLLLILGLALVISLRWRLLWPGRAVAALAAILMAGMAWDVGAVGVTLLIEAWMAYGLLGEVFSSHDC
jgi:hypothetical protein